MKDEREFKIPIHIFSNEEGAMSLRAGSRLHFA